MPGSAAPHVDALFSAAYEELRRLASAVRSQESSVTLSPTALVNEAWLKLSARPGTTPESPLHFKRIAARAMRQVLVEAARRRKDSGEIDRIATACRIADAALAQVAPRLGDGLTEVDVRDELELLMRRFGADGPSYATIVASPEYRAAKVDTTLAMLPGMLGPGTKPFDLRYRGPDGQVHDHAHIIQITNNPYRKGSGSRPRMDTGRLGVYALELKDDRAVAGLLAAVAAGDPDRFSGFNRWEPDTFEVTSDGPVDVGLDGEALVLDPPLRFAIRPAALRVRLPTGAIGMSPAARKLEARQALERLWRTALGRPAEVVAVHP